MRGFCWLLCCAFLGGSFVFLRLWALHERWCCWIFSAFKIKILLAKGQNVCLLTYVCLVGFVDSQFWTVTFSEIFSEIRRWRRWRCGSKFCWTTWSLELFLGRLLTLLWASKLYPCLCMYTASVYWLCQIVFCIGFNFFLICWDATGSKLYLQSYALVSVRESFCIRRELNGKQCQAAGSPTSDHIVT